MQRTGQNIQVILQRAQKKILKRKEEYLIEGSGKLIMTGLEKAKKESPEFFVTSAVVTC